MKIHKLSAYGLGAFVLTFGATLAFGQARVPYTRPPYVITPGSIQTSASGDQFVCTSTTATCEVESSASATTMTATVPAFDIGPTATPGTNDRLACFSYGPSGSKPRVMCVDDTGDVNMSRAYIGTPETANGARLHALSETTTYGPTVFNQNFTVIGRAAETGASSGGVFMSYHTTDNTGVIGSLSPASAWRPLTLVASEWRFRETGSSTIANITGTGAFNSVATSGNQAFTCTNVGCRFSLGDTSKFWYLDAGNDEYNISNGLSVGGSLRLFTGLLTARNSQVLQLSGAQADGASAVGVVVKTGSTYSTAGSKLVSFRNNTSELSFIDYLGNMSANSYTATATSGSSFTGGNSSTTMTLTSNTPDSVTSGTVPAIRLQASQDITGTDLLLSVEDSAGNRRMTVNEDGNANATTFGSGSSIVASTYMFSNDYSISTTSTNTITGRAVDGASSVGIVLRTTTNHTTDGAKIVSFRKNTTSEQASIDKDGLLRVNAANAARPTCNSTNRGKLFYLDGAAGVADTMEVCMKDASDNYDWETVASP